MKKLWLFLLVICTLLLPVSSWATTGSVVVGPPVKYFVQQVGWRATITITWVGDVSAGTVPATPIPLSTTPNNSVVGWYLYSVETVPGSPAPTNPYSITITDPNAVDLAGGLMASLSSTVPHIYCLGYSGSGFPIPVANPTLNITNSTNSSVGTVILTFSAN